MLFICFSFRKSCNLSQSAIKNLSHLQPIMFKIHNMFAVIKLKHKRVCSFSPEKPVSLQILTYNLPFHLATHAIYLCHLKTAIIGVHNIFMKALQNMLPFTLFSPKNNTHYLKLDSHVGYSLSFIKF